MPPTSKQINENYNTILMNRIIFIRALLIKQTLNYKKKVKFLFSKPNIYIHDKKKNKLKFDFIFFYILSNTIHGFLSKILANVLL